MMSDSLESASASSLKGACGTALLLAFGIGASETHLAIVIALNYIRSGVRGCFYSIVDLVSRIDAESRIPPGQIYWTSIKGQAYTPIDIFFPVFPT